MHLRMSFSLMAQPRALLWKTHFQATKTNLEEQHQRMQDHHKKMFHHKHQRSKYILMNKAGLKTLVRKYQLIKCYLDNRILHQNHRRATLSTRKILYLKSKVRKETKMQHGSGEQQAIEQIEERKVSRKFKSTSKTQSFILLLL